MAARRAWSDRAKRLAVAIRFCSKGREVLRKLLGAILAVNSVEWPEWCNEHVDVIKERRDCYKNTHRLPEPHDQWPDIEDMDITYLAHILLSSNLIEEEMKGLVSQVKEARNSLCHYSSDSMKESSFDEFCGGLLPVFNEIVMESFKGAAERAARDELLQELADATASKP